MQGTPGEAVGVDEQAAPQDGGVGRHRRDNMRYLEVSGREDGLGAQTLALKLPYYYVLAWEGVAVCIEKV